MISDEGRHEEIRERVVEVLQKGAYKDYEVISSPGSEGDIDLFSVVGKENPYGEAVAARVHLFRPDLIVEKEGRSLVIEIESGSTPKRLLGVAMATFMAEKIEYSGTVRDLGERSLLIILDNENDRVLMEGGNKGLQISYLIAQVREKFGLDFEIVMDDMATLKIKKWIRDGRLEIADPSKKR